MDPEESGHLQGHMDRSMASIRINDGPIVSGPELVRGENGMTIHAHSIKIHLNKSAANMSQSIPTTASSSIHPVYLEPRYDPCFDRKFGHILGYFGGPRSQTGSIGISLGVWVSSQWVGTMLDPPRLIHEPPCVIRRECARALRALYKRSTLLPRRDPGPESF